jgi:Na+/melibiose symporter-like transporter
MRAALPVGMQHGAARLLPWAFLIYAAASLLHFAHNAVYLPAYPNLPQTWGSSEVWLAWCAVSAIGLLGYLLWRGQRRGGLTLLVFYACCGFAGLLHYQRAGFHRHTVMMNLTILTEVAAAAALLLDVLVLARRHSR